MERLHGDIRDFKNYDLEKDAINRKLAYSIRKYQGKQVKSKENAG